MADLSKSARKLASQCTALRVRQASRVLTKIYDEELRPLGIQSSQLPVLTALAIFGEPGATMSALAKVLVLDRTTLTRNVQPLEKAGLLRVARSPDDARVRVVLLTRAGERTLEAAFPVWERAIERVRATLGALATEALHSSLDQVIGLSPEP